MESSLIACPTPPTLEISELEISSLEISDLETPGYSGSQPQPEGRSQPSAESSTKPLEIGQEVRIFLSSFITIFLAELGDKTQLTTLLISAESNSPWIVFLGAGSALIATSLLGVLVGCWLARRVSARTLETAAAALLLLISVSLLWDVMQG